MNNQTTVILADDHPMFRLGLKAAIEMDADFEVVGEADDGWNALALIDKKKPDVALVDWRMPKVNGLQLLQQVTQRRLFTRVIILTMYEEDALFNEALDAGVSGFVLKHNAVSDILECLKTVRGGDVYLSPSVSRALLRRTRRVIELRREKPGLTSLTPGERRVLRLVAENKTTKEIASNLGLSPYTIETHRRNISQKMDLQGSHSLLQFAIQHKSSL